MNNFNKWFSTFIEEKHLPYASWEITDSSETTHFIDSDVVIEMIRNTTSVEDQRKIKEMIIRIDFCNGDVNHFFKHLAKGMVKQYEAEKTL